MKEQSYANHTAWFPLFHFVVTPILLAYTIRSVWLLVQAPSGDAAWSAAFAVAVFLGAFASRLMPLKVQDRVIRLEMRLRLTEVLPEDLRHSIHKLAPAQLVALRFACDEELPDLVRKVLAGQLTDQKAIKQAIQKWEADHLRA